MAGLRVVLDTNVLVSGLAYPQGIPGRILAAWWRGGIDVVLSRYILDEFGAVAVATFSNHPKSNRNSRSCRQLYVPGRCRRAQRGIRTSITRPDRSTNSWNIAGCACGVSHHRRQGFTRSRRSVPDPDAGRILGATRRLSFPEFAWGDRVHTSDSDCNRFLRRSRHPFADGIDYQVRFVEMDPMRAARGDDLLHVVADAGETPVGKRR